PELENMKALLAAVSHGGETESELYSIAELEVYMSCVEKLYNFFENSKDICRSSGIRQLSETIRHVYEGEAFQTLKSQTAQLTYSVRNIKSITIGVNLDTQLR